MNIRNYKTAKERREAIEKELSVTLPNTGTFSLDELVASSRHCENMIGVTQVPLGIAGPLSMRSATSSQPLPVSRYIPLATTEGALVASVSRGCKAITASGGATTMSERVGATRGPVFRVQNIQESQRFVAFLDDHFSDLKNVASMTSHHIALTSYTTSLVGRHQFVRFVFNTQDAMGLNMVTIATDAMVTYIKKHAGISCVSLSGNYCVDKKPSWQNIVYGRGTKVWAEVTVPKRVLEETLKTTARDVYSVWLAKCMMGSIASGSMAFNAQYANVVAAIFLATGQDIAHVVEGSLGVTTAEIQGEDLCLSVYLPDLLVGTVGGGTSLATQKEGLSMMGISEGSDGSDSQHFAEIIASAVLAGELSLLSSLEQGTLAVAHKTLARGGANV